MNKHRNIYLLSDEEHDNTLLLGETLAEEHPIYNVVVDPVKKAPNQETEIDTLLDLKYRLTHDEFGEYINHDIKPCQSNVYYFTPKQNGKAYAGSLDDEGQEISWKSSAYGQTMHELYMEVLQLFSYLIYSIAPMPRRETMVTPCSACDLAESYRLAGEDENEDE